MKIHVPQVPHAPDALLSPRHTLWNGLHSSSIVLQPTPLENQPSEYVRHLTPHHGRIHRLEVRCAHNRESIFIHFKWTDASKDVTASDPHPFPDAAAVMFPMPTPEPMVFEGDPVSMGADDIEVNAWLWRPDFGDYAKNILAKGFGTSRRLASSIILAKADWSSGSWQIVFSRALAGQTGGTENAQLPQPGQVPVAFAVWEGSNHERAGLKATSPYWHVLEIGA